jgi:hypothetical protein
MTEQTRAALQARMMENARRDHEDGRRPNPGRRVKCLSCGDIIQSMFRHDFKQCSCASVSIDGGGSYTRLGFKDPNGYEFLPDEVEVEGSEE